MTNTRATTRLALAAAGVTVVLWASAFVSIRSAGAAYSPARSPSAGSFPELSSSERSC
ncbi:hypothetical protein BTZ20_0837 [Rhodococcus sp. MTM3W5.2]|uniref:hypothetical protein n=1 Tax=Rhodococcus sp. MTM3W5.2 TaxID=1805827 RepID=UPI0009792BB0|nr:hypothetical protein [Rhodococcus sp. MTM3W5.2]AQA26083.1 hypothetical protein BTZ20_0837 [Rhodococcus sp. MTM3W5.2]